MASLFQSLRWVHISAGSIALILFWIPAIARKGGKTHIRAGWTYVVCMSVVVVTAFGGRGLGLSARREHPGSLYGVVRWFHASAEQGSGWQGIWAIETGKDPK